MLDGCIKYAIKLPSSQDYSPVAYRTKEWKWIPTQLHVAVWADSRGTSNVMPVGTDRVMETHGNCTSMSYTMYRHTKRNPREWGRAASRGRRPADAACVHAWVTSLELSHPTDRCVRSHVCRGPLHNATSHWLVSYASATFHWIAHADVCDWFRTTCAAHRGTRDFSSFFSLKRRGL